MRSQSVKGHKPQKGNQFGCHDGPYNRNSAPSTVHKLPLKHHQPKHERFFKPVAVSTEGSNDLALTVACLVTSLSCLGSRPK